MVASHLKRQSFLTLLLLALVGPSVFCLQGTFLKPDDNITFKGYNLYGCFCIDDWKPSSGGSVLVRSSCPQRGLGLTTALQAVAVLVSLGGEVAVCSVCVPPDFRLRSRHLDSLLEQLPPPYLLLGGFGGRNVLWNCGGGSTRGEIIENFIAADDLCLVSDGSCTCLCPATGGFSSLDLSMCRPSLLLDFGWSVYEDRRSKIIFLSLLKV